MPLLTKGENTMKKKITCERKNGELMTLETTMKLLNFMYDSNMIVRAWYEEKFEGRYEVFGTDVW